VQAYNNSKLPRIEMTIEAVSPTPFEKKKNMPINASDRTAVTLGPTPFHSAIIPWRRA
jgi:hypothetical protein